MKKIKIVIHEWVYMYKMNNISAAFISYFHNLRIHEYK